MNIIQTIEKNRKEKRQIIKDAIFLWKETMRKAYPGIDLIKWSRNSEYRFKHPQPTLINKSLKK